MILFHHYEELTQRSSTLQQLHLQKLLYFQVFQALDEYYLGIWPVKGEVAGSECKVFKSQDPITAATRGKFKYTS